MADPLTTLPIWRIDGEESRRVTDQVVTEEPLSILLNGTPWQVMLRTPGADAALITGLLFGEGLIASAADLVRIESAETAQEDLGNTLNVVLAHDHSPAPVRTGVMNSACGLCGSTLLREICWPRVTGAMLVDPDVLRSLPDQLRSHQELFQATGGIHAAGLFTSQGELLAVAEDVGRHNAVDKVIGLLLQSGLASLPDTILQISGRGGYEILLKAWRAGIPMVAAVGAPSSLAVQVAEQSGITLVGFMRGKKANVYTHPERAGLGVSS